MAKIFYNPNTSTPEPIIQLRWAANDDEMMTTPPGSSFVEFDGDSNTSLIQAINTSWDSFTVSGAGAVLHNGAPVTINPPTEQHQAEAAAASGYAILPEWAKTGTGAAAEAYINGQIFNGATQAQVDAWIDANVTGSTVAALRASTIKALKYVGDALVAERELFKIAAKLMIYVRDLVIRFRKS